MIKLSPRTVEGYSSIKHPFSKAKMDIIDAFTALVGCPCSAQCNADRNIILIVASDHPKIKEYQVLECSSCKEQTWYVLSHAAA